MEELREYLTPEGKSPFGEWFARLDCTAAARIARALLQLELGNYSNVKGVGRGVFEYRVFFGPGYRVYFGKDGEHLVILLGGGSKSGQRADIAAANSCWRDYRNQMRQQA